MSNSTPCKSCGAPLLWAKTASGASMPLSAKTKEKRFVLADGDGTAMFRDTYLSHFADCPHAKEHRRGSYPPAGKAR